MTTRHEELRESLVLLSREDYIAFGFACDVARNLDPTAGTKTINSRVASVLADLVHEGTFRVGHLIPPGEFAEGVSGGAKELADLGSKAKSEQHFGNGPPEPPWFAGSCAE